MNKILRTALAVILTASLSACNLLSPGDIENPNVDENTFVNSESAMTAWVNGADKQMATVMSSYCQLLEIMSDNYFNNYSMTSQVFDIPQIRYTDDDVTTLQRGVGTLRETAIQGLEVVAKADKTTTQDQLFELTYIKGYSYLLAGEFFRGLPMTNGGEVKTWQENLQEALNTFGEALKLTTNKDSLAFVYTFMARASYRLGDKNNAVRYAEAALQQSQDFVKQVQFDGANGMTNWIQFYLWEPKFQPLPRLDFLDPKYFQTQGATEQRPITIAKAEEPYLILAEAALSDNDVGAAKNWLSKLLSLVKSRPIQQGVNDQTEGRGTGGYKLYPNSSDYRVAASAEDTLRTGLVIDRAAPHLINVPYISGTSVTQDMIDRTMDADSLLEITYLLRQEIFIAEGRRVADLGIRLPVCETEAANTPSAQDYLEAQIPSFIPLNKEMDAFEMDSEKSTVIIKYNMNRIIVQNKLSPYVCPFVQ